MEKFPFIVGCLGNSDWKVPRPEDSPDWEGACMIKKSGSSFRMVANKKNDSLLLINGGPVTEPFTVEEDQVCTLQFASTPLCVFVGKDPKAWAEQITRDRWEVINGAVGASRAVCDAGWLDHSYQIGLTGKTVTPDIYITVGISGASQHMAGCSASKNIIAINKDGDANIFKEASFGVVGDWEKVLPSFTAAIRELLSS